ncbi:aminotransferase class I/II-fold pyridoxal phosphate-dependent enzyme [Entomomonas asaccharolytica]|uniref:Aminotransferase n=1 Tax=Entomomonas asaccharolytica TaxID=2785331 RepID=A0A974NH47_9GAMM|nr:aminotransferase class I/II-fold pyridoxal phosphate-dependent enzyme [Entomomonas asaccharolytica]QQP86468.1 aminotransferase class I/II-fold pyridoxal phosphate-dependent enzyme [Entomomonas asaccharolytica]
MINGHGDDGYQYPIITANFSSNVYHQSDLSGLEQYLAQHIEAIYSYPEPDAVSIRKLLAEQANITDSCISVTNGATEAIYLIAQAFVGSKTTIASPVFSEYADACEIHQHQLQHVFNISDIPAETELCWLCSPNNPTGEVYSEQQLLTLFKQYPTTYFVIDQSYAAFAENALLAIDKVIQYPNVIVLHSMTKKFAIPGLRLGYLVANSDLIARINYFRMPWSVNSLAIVAGKYLLQHANELQVYLLTLLQQTKQLQQALAAFKQLQVLPTQTHYFLVKLLNGKSAAELKNYLANKHHLLIRDAANFVGLDQYYFRVASQSVAQNNQLVAAIGEWLTEQQ